jgi:hypothetical protein
MIRLKTLLTEITLGRPFATQFAWRPVSRDSEVYESEFDADGRTVQLTMLHAGDNEWHFAFLLPGAGGRTTSHSKSTAVGATSYLRIIATVGEAILDFCVNRAPDVINISGADSDSEKAAQKTRLYAAFCRHNAARIASIGYTAQVGHNALWLIRKSHADATGVNI